MGGKPSKGTPADRRLKANTGSSSSGGKRAPVKQTGKPIGGMPMKPPVAKPMAMPRRGTPKHY